MSRGDMGQQLDRVTMVTGSPVWVGVGVLEQSGQIKREAGLSGRPHRAAWCPSKALSVVEINDDFCEISIVFKENRICLAGQTE